MRPPRASLGAVVLLFAAMLAMLIGTLVWAVRVIHRELRPETWLPPAPSAWDIRARRA